ncbi:MAG: hypothetical protein ACE5GO_01805 [Anaerolineales bacterium]
MRINKVVINVTVAEKIEVEHGVDIEEVEDALSGHVQAFKAKYGRYMVIAHTPRYITIIFDYKHGIADVITAYPASKWQIRLLKRKGKRKRR